MSNNELQEQLDKISHESKVNLLHHQEVAKELEGE